MIRLLLNAILARWFQSEIDRIDARIAETEADIDGWPKTRGAWLIERSRLEMARDRASGKDSRVSYLFSGPRVRG